MKFSLMRNHPKRDYKTCLQLGTFSLILNEEPKWFRRTPRTYRSLNPPLCCSFLKIKEENNLCAFSTLGNQREKKWNRFSYSPSFGLPQLKPPKKLTFFPFPTETICQPCCSFSSPILLSSSPSLLSLSLNCPTFYCFLPSFSSSSSPSLYASWKIVF